MNHPSVCEKKCKFINTIICLFDLENLIHILYLHSFPFHQKVWFTPGTLGQRLFLQESVAVPALASVGPTPHKSMEPRHWTDASMTFEVTTLGAHGLAITLASFPTPHSSSFAFSLPFASLLPWA